MRSITIVAISAFLLILGSSSGCGRSRQNPVDPTKPNLDGAARQVLNNEVAFRIRNTIHPTGVGGTLEAIDIKPEGSGVEVHISVSWKGGLTSRPYATRILWRFNKEDHLGSDIIADDSPIPAAEANKRELDNYLRGLMPSIRQRL
jgi:hypothetical protein